MIATSSRRKAALALALDRGPILVGMADTTAVPSPSPNPRAVPHDLRQLAESASYVVASTSSEATAENAVRELAAAGFTDPELVLVSDRVDTLRPFEDRDAIEVSNPISTARASGKVAGGATGAGFGALIALAIGFLGSAPLESFGLFVALGALIGAVVGFFAGQALVSRMSRKPVKMFESMVADGAILVGVGFPEDVEAERVRVATTALTAAGLEPKRIG